MDHAPSWLVQTLAGSLILTAFGLAAVGFFAASSTCAGGPQPAGSGYELLYCNANNTTPALALGLVALGGAAVATAGLVQGRRGRAGQPAPARS